jgi:hypothetical protein
VRSILCSLILAGCTCAPPAASPAPIVAPTPEEPTATIFDLPAPAGTRHLCDEHGSRTVGDEFFSGYASTSDFAEVREHFRAMPGTFVPWSDGMAALRLEGGTREIVFGTLSAPLHRCGVEPGPGDRTYLFTRETLGR